MRGTDGEFDPGSPEFKEALLRDARKDFPAFYGAATAVDAHLMDGLILGHAAMAVLLNVPREHVAEPIRYHLERTSDAVA